MKSIFIFIFLSLPVLMSAVSIDFVIAVYSALDDENQKFSFVKQKEKKGQTYWLGTNKFKKTVIGLFGNKDNLKSAMLVGYPSTQEDLTTILSNMNGLMYFFTKDKKASSWLLECIRQFAKGGNPEPFATDEATINFYIEDGALNLELYFNRYFSK